MGENLSEINRGPRLKKQRWRGGEEEGHNWNPTQRASHFFTLSARELLHPGTFLTQCWPNGRGSVVGQKWMSARNLISDTFLRFKKVIMGRHTQSRSQYRCVSCRVSTCCYVVILTVAWRTVFGLCFWDLCCLCLSSSLEITHQYH